MKIGIPKEIKDNDNRVALSPYGARTLVQAGHEVRVEEGAGLGSGFSYAEAGAHIRETSRATTHSDKKVADSLDLTHRYREFPRDRGISEKV